MYALAIGRKASARGSSRKSDPWAYVEQYDAEIERRWQQYLALGQQMDAIEAEMQRTLDEVNGMIDERNGYASYTDGEIPSIPHRSDY